MAGKTKINGTAYTIKGGKTKVNGTAYSISKGKTLIGGTAKTITLNTPSLPSGCIAEYLFDGNTNDTSGSGYNLANYNGTISDSSYGNLGKMITFTGTGEMYSSASVINNTPFSVSLWVKRENTSINACVFSTNNGYSSGLRMFTYTSRTEYHLCYSSTSAVNYGGSALTNAWTHIVMTFTNDTSTDGLKVYINGSLAGSKTFKAISSSGVLRFCRMNNTGDDASSVKWQGSLAKVRFYRRVLSSSEVSVLYNNGQGI